MPFLVSTLRCTNAIKPLAFPNFKWIISTCPKRHQILMVCNNSQLPLSILTYRCRSLSEWTQSITQYFPPTWVCYFLLIAVSTTCSGEPGDMAIMPEYPGRKEPNEWSAYHLYWWPRETWLATIRKQPEHFLDLSSYRTQLSQWRAHHICVGFMVKQYDTSVPRVTYYNE